MFWNKRNVRVNEEYALVQSIEKARASWSEVQAWRISEKEAMNEQMPKILAELRYRYLLREARKRNVINRWSFEIQAEQAD